MPRLALLALVLLAGCTPGSPPAAPAPPVSLPAAATPPAIPPVASPATSPADPDAPPPGEPLPPAPMADRANAHKSLTPANDLLLETRPDPANPGKSKPVRVLVKSEVCLPTTLLEVFLCRNHTKEHEAVLRTPVDAKLLHAALVVAGAKPGTPVQWVNPTTNEADYKPATGDRIAVTVYYRKAGRLYTHPAQDWVQDTATKKPMTQQWVFAGSQTFPHPDGPPHPDAYGANGGDVISLSNFAAAMLDVPVKSSDANDALAFAPIPDRLPPPRSGVWLILTPAGR